MPRAKRPENARVSWVGSSPAAAIAARQGEKAQELMHRHLSDVQRYINEHAFPGVAAAAQ